MDGLPRWAFAAWCTAILLLGATRARGQAAPDGAGTSLGPLNVQGTASLLLEGYGAEGIAGRRAPARAQVATRATFDLFGLSSGLELLYSTDQSGLRQSVNRVGFFGTWRFVTVEAGDVTPRYARYGLSGITLRGGAVGLAPGPLRFGFAAGRAQRAVAPSPLAAARDPAYRRMLYAALVGVERGGSRFQLSGVVARDDSTSIDGGTRVAPRENLAVTPELRLDLLGGRLDVEAEATLSALTHDTRATELDGVRGSELPAVLAGLITPRTTTGVAMAGRAGLGFQAGPLSFRGSYERIEPGYEALGVDRLRPDQEVVQLRPRLTLLGRRLTVDASMASTRNNLKGQRLRTTRRLQLGGSVRAQASRAFSVAASLQQVRNASEPTDPAATRTEQVARILSLMPAVSIAGGAASHTASLTLSLQKVTDESDPPIVLPLGGEPGSTAFTGGLSYVVAFASGLSFNASGTGMSSEAAGAATAVRALSLGAGRSFLERALSVNLAANLSTTTTELELADDRSSRQLGGTASASYRLPTGDVLRFDVRGTDSRATAGSGRSFRELFTTLRFEHRF